MEPEVKEIAEIVCSHFGITVDEAVSRKRTAQMITARAFIMQLVKDILGSDKIITYKWLAGQLERDHATAIHTLRQHETRMKIEREYRWLFDEVKGKVNSSVTGLAWIISGAQL
jgi:chromosomal replication initiation ATPase DnaA